MRALLGDPRRYSREGGSGKGEGGGRSRRVRPGERSGTAARDLEPRVHAVRSATGCIPHTPARAFRRHRRRTRAHRRRHAGRSVELRHRPVRAHHRAGGRGIGTKYDRGERGASYRVLADHARAVAFLLADGLYPSNEGRGYVVRRILRRAVRHAWLLGRREPTLVHLVHTVSGLMGSVYPELVQKRSHLDSVTRAEEERFFDTIEGGLERLEQLQGAKTISGAEAFKLYDTFGFPIDLTQLIAGERGQTVDVAGLERELGKQRTRSLEALERRKAGDAAKGAVHVKRAGEWRSVKPRAKQKWVGYDTTRAETDVLRFRQASDGVEVVLQENPFYAESGGQVSDTGQVKGEAWTLDAEGVEEVDGVSAVVGHFADGFDSTPAVAQIAELRRN